MPATTLADREIETTTLPNGIRVISETMAHVRSVSVGLWISAGSRREAGEQNGISHFIEHMVFKGTVHRTAEEIARSVDSIGGNLDAFTSKELVSFNTKVLDEHLPTAFDVIADLVLNPLFEHDDIEKEKSVILEELKMEADNPEYLVHEVFSSNFWKDHALGKPILGTRETIRGFARPMMEDFYHSVYSPRNLLLTAAGNLRHTELVGLAGRYFGGMKPIDPLPSEAPPRTHARITLRNKSALEQVHLCLGVPSLPAAHEMRFAIYVLNTLLGGSMSSRLFQNIREKRGLAYAVFSELNAYTDTGCLAVYAGTSLETTRKVVDLILEEFARFKNETVPDEELRRAKDYMKGSLMLGLESTSSRMANLARQYLYFGRFFALDEIIQGIERVSAEDLRRLAQTFFDPKQIGLTILGHLDGFRLGREDLVC
ncbi:MAG: M16 family metallopeptidase [Bryobacteraceae bacterium]